MTGNENDLLGDCVEVTNEPHKEFYAIVIGSGYRDELELSILNRNKS